MWCKGWSGLLNGDFLFSTASKVLSLQPITEPAFLISLSSLSVSPAPVQVTRWWKIHHFSARTEGSQLPKEMDPHSSSPFWYTKRGDEGKINFWVDLPVQPVQVLHHITFLSQVRQDQHVRSQSNNHHACGFFSHSDYSLHLFFNFIGSQVPMKSFFVSFLF